MLNIVNKSRNIWFNLALEEYLLREITDDAFMIWQSDRCIVAGKHQNIIAEINNPYVFENKIKLARRLSGGGTVVHSQGNINFTFLINGEDGKQIDFNRAVKPVIEFLNSLGLKVYTGEKNELLLNGKKISGNAEHIYKNRILHHGTLLFKADLEDLNNCIKVKKNLYYDKAIQSNRSEITNIADHLQSALSLQEFSKAFENFLSNKYKPVVSLNITESVNEVVQKLYDEKYSSKEWIYGYSPLFEVRSNIVLDTEICHFTLKIVKGIIAAIEFKDCKHLEIRNILESLKDEYFIYETIKRRMELKFIDSDLTERILQSLF